MWRKIHRNSSCTERNKYTEYPYRDRNGEVLAHVDIMCCTPQAGTRWLSQEFEARKTTLEHSPHFLEKYSYCTFIFQILCADFLPQLYSAGERLSPEHQIRPRKGNTRKLPGHQAPQKSVSPMLWALSCTTTDQRRSNAAQYRLQSYGRLYKFTITPA